GPIRTQATEVLEMLNDPTRCRVMLVTLPEEMPVSETIEAAYRLEDQAGVQLGPVVVNCVESVAAGLSAPAAETARAVGVSFGADELVAVEGAREFALGRHDLQASQIERL